MLADAAELEVHRTALRGHCYRMLGSAFDADDAVQETLVRAWRTRAGFEGRSSLRTWLYRIATNVCLDALAERSRRTRPVDDGPLGTPDDSLQVRPRTHWLEPIPDADVLPGDESPFETTRLRESVRLAFVAALQHLPPRQRAALLLADVLGLSAVEIGECLEMSVAAVNSALQRARATIARRDPVSARGPLSDEQAALLNRYVDAFLRYDVDELTSLLREDAILSMPPYTLWLQGHDAIRTWLAGRGSGCRGSRLIPTRACGGPAFGQYRPNPDGGHSPWALVILDLADDGIRAWTSFLDVETLFPLFDLPPALPAVR
ncbi:MAG TPA: sigma-70 family RNA polymerase sigma factor [Vicinamibacterales bacterium]|nr:sigma-70 family RNA polymerase sigma factor [Vicinamibacterales bacterium]